MRERREPRWWNVGIINRVKGGRGDEDWKKSLEYYKKILYSEAQRDEEVGLIRWREWRVMSGDVRTCEQWGKRRGSHRGETSGGKREVQDPGGREGMKGEISRVVGGRYDDAAYCDWCDILAFELSRDSRFT